MQKPLLKSSYLGAILMAAVVFSVAIILGKGILWLLPTSIVWVEQVLKKALLIGLSLLAIKVFLKSSFAGAGFKRATSPTSKAPIILYGALLGGISSVLIFFTPAEGNPLIKQLNLLEFFLIIVIWSSLAEEIFIRGLLQTYLAPLASQKIKIMKLEISKPVLTCAAIFGGMHFTLLLSDIDLFTVLITVMSTFLLGLFAGHYREKYNSIFPSLLTHMSFNLGGIVTGIIIGIAFKLITGEFPQ